MFSKIPLLIFFFYVILHVFPVFSTAASSPKKAPRAKKDPNAPKRAPSAYIIFCTEKRPEIQKKNPEATFGELGKLLGKLWGEMDEKAKAPYAKQSATRKAELAK